MVTSVLIWLDIVGRNPSNWTLNEWYYNGILYDSTDAFRDAWKRGEVEKTPPNLDGHWTASEPESIGIEGRELTAPVMVQPHGPRVQVDVKEKFVKWSKFPTHRSFRS
jgi:primary-amine oxidase